MNKLDNKTASTQHAVLVSSPGMGHFVPVIELAKRLSSLHSFKSTVLFVTTSQSSSASHGGVDVLEIPAADITHVIQPEAMLVTKIRVVMRETGPAVRAAISGLKPEPNVLICDMFATEYLSIGKELQLRSFVYLPSSAWFLALTVNCPVLDKEVEGEYVDQTEKLKIPGCNPVRPDDVVEPMLERRDQQYREYLQMGAEIPLFDGALVNTWKDLEHATLKAFSNEAFLKSVIKVPVYAIGPLTKPMNQEKNSEILEWLNRQPARSVIYVSFGSGGTLSKAQMDEVAWGLELSQQRFIWVVRPPVDGEASGSYFGSKGDDDDVEKFKYLPAGFTERTSKLGLLVNEWAPQTEILSRASIGGFLTHCGWNSTLESLINGVPMIAWPMFAEQRMNATMLAEELKVAIRPSESPARKVVGREEIEKMVRSVIEGEEGRCMRLRAVELQASAMKALSDGGSSAECLSHFVQICNQA